MEDTSKSYRALENSARNLVPGRQPAWVCKPKRNTFGKRSGAAAAGRPSADQHERIGRDTS